MRKTTNY